MPQNIENIKILCPECLGQQSVCPMCEGEGLVLFKSIVGLDRLADSCVEDYYIKSVFGFEGSTVSRKRA
jgi:hypothetical protein